MIKLGHGGTVLQIPCDVGIVTPQTLTIFRPCSVKGQEGVFPKDGCSQAWTLLTSNNPKTDVIRQVRLKAHRLPMMSTRIPHVNAPKARPGPCQLAESWQIGIRTTVGATPDVCGSSIWYSHLLIHSTGNQTNTLSPRQIKEVAKPAQEEDVPLVAAHAMTVQLAVDDVGLLLIQRQVVHVGVVEVVVPAGRAALELAIVDGAVLVVGHVLRNELVDGGHDGGGGGSSEKSRGGIQA